MLGGRYGCTGVALRVRIAVCTLAGCATLAGTGTAVAARWSVQPVPLPAVPNGRLVAVSCAARAACSAVGFFAGSGNVRVTLAERWNGRRWSIQPTPTPTGATADALEGVSCASSRECMAVGYLIDSAGTRIALAQLWNGARWAVRSTHLPRGARGSSLSGVSCPSPRDCTAVGSVTNGSGVGEALVERWNGSRWSIPKIPTPPRAVSSSLSGVSCTSSSACTAVGFASSRGPLVERWNGSGWSIERSPTRGVLNGVWCTARTACIAVGSFASRARAERWNGKRWSPARIANPKPPPNDADNTYSIASTLNAVTCAAPGACVAVGSSSITDFCDADSCPLTTHVALAERWDGSRWSITKTRFSPGFSGVSCSSGSACTAVGPDINSFGVAVTLAERWNGTSWAVQRTADPGGATNGLAGWLNGVSCSSARACTAVGFYSYGNTEAPLAERWDGTSWKAQSPLYPPAMPGDDQSTFTGVSCTSATICTVVGAVTDSTGALTTWAERWNGSSWKVQHTPRPPAAGPGEDTVLTGASCTSASACTAVGYYTDNGDFVVLVDRWDGASWNIQQDMNPPGVTGGELLAVSCTSNAACTALGNGRGGHGPPFIESWNGIRWSLQSTPSPSDGLLNGLSCTTVNACIAVGLAQSSPDSQPQPLAEVWDGIRWTIESPANPPGTTGSELNGVSCTAARTCTAVGSSATSNVDASDVPLAEVWDGGSWTIQSGPTVTSSTGAILDAVSCALPTACTAVGNLNPAGAGQLLSERFS